MKEPSLHDDEEIIVTDAEKQPTEHQTQQLPQDAEGNTAVRYYFAQQQHRLYPVVRRKKNGSRKPCNCARSKCLKLYCECFASGQMCVDCNCKDCYNNFTFKSERLEAVKSILDKNPTAFAPKIAFGRRASDLAVPSSMEIMKRAHRSGCHCKKSSCLKNYCECYEAKVACTDRCKCIGCRNSEAERSQRDCFRIPASPGLIGLAASASMDSARSPSPSPLLESDESDGDDDELERLDLNALKLSPAWYLNDEVVDATTRCLLTAAAQVQEHQGNDGDMQLAVMGEFSRCLAEVITRSMENAEPADDELGDLVKNLDEDYLLRKLEVVNAASATTVSAQQSTTTSTTTSTATNTYRLIGLKQQDLKRSTYESTTAHNTNSSNPSTAASTATTAPSSVERGAWANNDDFTRRLIDAVKKQPSLYNPNHEHYGNKHTNSQIRNAIWAQLCDELGFPDGAQQLQTVWKRIRDRYVRERRRRRLADQSGSGAQSNNGTNAGGDAGNATVTSQNAACRHFDSMRWIDSYIFESNSTSKQSGSSSQPAQHQNTSSETPTMYYLQSQSADPNNSELSYRSNHQDFLNVSTTSTANSSLNFSHNGSVLDTSGSPCSSTTSSEISVGSTSFTATASSKGPQQTATTLSIPTPSEQGVYGKQLEGKDGSIITITQRGKIPAKKDAQRIAPKRPPLVPDTANQNVNVSGANVVRMFVDPTQLQMAASQKVYRIVSANELSSLKSSIGATVPVQQLATSAATSQSTRFTTGRKRPAANASSEPTPILPHPSGSSAVVQLNGRPSNGHLNEEMIMDDGLGDGGQRQIVMESGNGDENVKFNIVQNVLDPNTVTPTMVTIGNANVQLQPHHMNQTIQIASTSHQMSAHQQQQQVVSVPNNVRFVQARTLQQGVPQGAQILAQPTQYIITTAGAITDESYLANHLANTLANMTDDDKTVFKLAIQRIIMDARFGDGTSVRMLSADSHHPQVVTVAAPTVLTAVNLEQQQQLGGLIVHSVPVSLAATSLGVPVTTSAQQTAMGAGGGRR